jgi:uncharacterized surface protein with fasciclin (FAS1) repeats
MFRQTIFAIATIAALGSPAVAQDLVDTIAAQGSLARLNESIQAAGLTETLRGEGPFTLFAPNDNDAFMLIEEGGEFEQLLMDQPRLTAVLTYHVVPGRLMSSDFEEGMTLTTLQGGELVVTLEGGLRVDGANILASDIEASNGVIHVIDSILTPE